MVSNRSFHYNVVPRYTPGSPALVDTATGRQVAKEERAAYERVLTGAYGEDEKRRAERLGLSGIVYEYREHGRGRNPMVTLRDEITGEIREMRWAEFSQWSERNRRPYPHRGSNLCR